MNNMVRYRDKIWQYLIDVKEVFKEIASFILYLPIYFGGFLKGLRIFHTSYKGIIKSIKDTEKITKKDSISLQYRSDLDAEVVRLKNELEKMFNQLFGIFIATLALIVSICALVINLKK